MNELRTMHLFAGIGGGLLADRILGHRPVVAVEWEPYACQVLRERAADGWFTELRVWEGDVRMFDPSEYAGQVDCIHAGFPCQDISVAGKQAGVSDGTRSGLYREVLRIADTVRPKYLFLENVAAILSNGLGTVLGDLAAMGYDTRWLCIRASDVGAPHHRDRWFCRAVRNTKHPRWNAAEITGSVAQGSDRYQTRAEQAIKSTGSSDADVADAKSEQCNGRKDHTGKQLEHGSISESGNSCWSKDMADPGSARLQRREIAGSDGSNGKKSVDELATGRDWRTEWFETESRLDRVANGIPHRVQRLKGLGNAQVPLQAAVAWKLLGGE